METPNGKESIGRLLRNLDVVKPGVRYGVEYEEEEGSTKDIQMITFALLSMDRLKNTVTRAQAIVPTRNKKSFS